MSNDADPEPDTAPEPDQNPMRRALDFLVLAPVGVALTVAEELPALIVGGRQRFETDVRNARVVGQFVVTRAQRDVVGRVNRLLHGESTDPAPAPAPPPLPPPRRSHSPLSGRTGRSRRIAIAASPSPSASPTADPADAVVVDAALAGYDTLSASQVVRRLESLGPDELRAVFRHESSHRNRRTILNRAQQLLDDAGPDRPVG